MNMNKNQKRSRQLRSYSYFRNSNSETRNKIGHKKGNDLPTETATQDPPRMNYILPKH